MENVIFSHKSLVQKTLSTIVWLVNDAVSGYQQYLAVQLYENYFFNHTSI